MVTDFPFELNSVTLDAIPIINHFIDRLRMGDLLKRYLDHNNTRNDVPPSLVIGVLLRNIVLGREPIYGLKEWTSSFAPDLFHLQPNQIELINDDRIGRALEKLFDADRASLMTETVVWAIHEFELDMDQLHNDSTTVTFSGQYDGADGTPKHGKETLKITEGHSKDHRPDLKQLLWILTVTSDGAVPVHYRACDGNTTDDTTHIETWKTLQNLVGRPDFMYVGDSKLCVRGTLQYIDGEGGSFITVMPGTRSEDKWFRDYITGHDVSWEEVCREQNPYRKDDAPEVWRAVESLIPSAEGFRIVWFWSSQKARHDMYRRQAMMKEAIIKLEQLETRLRNKRCRLRTREVVEKAADDIIQETRVQRWIHHKLIEEVETIRRQTKRGRPGPNTQYVVQHKKRFHVGWDPYGENIDADSRTDGIFPLITNRDDLSCKEILDIYKYQPNLEKRHEQLKTVYKVAPMMLKNIMRIEGLLFLYFLALLIQALIERQIRLGMEKAGVRSLPLYYEDRECITPTAPRIFDLFNNLHRHFIIKDRSVVQVVEPKYIHLHGQILDLLDVPRNVYPGMIE